MLHRPGPELSRLTPRNNDQLLFDGVPWVARAQEEHDAFAQALRDRGVEVLLLDRLLAEVLAFPAARSRADRRRRRRPAAGHHPAAHARRAHLADLAPTSWPPRSSPGWRTTSCAGGRGLAYRLMDRGDFVVPPLPNLLFTRDSSVWVGDEVAVTSLAMPARHRESTITAAVYTHHPRFAGHRAALRLAAWSTSRAATCCCWPPAWSPSGSASGRRRAVRSGWRGGCSTAGWRTPCSSSRSRSSGRPCTSTPSRTMVDVDAMVMYPAVADALLGVDA